VVESHALDPQAQLFTFKTRPLVRAHVGMVKLAHTLDAALQYMFDVAHRFGVPTVPHAQGPALIIPPFSWPQAQHVGASVGL
jgi:hypothetical protein